MKHLFLTGMMILGAVSLFSAESITAAKPDDFVGSASPTFSNGETTIKGGSLFSRKTLDIDTKKRYRLSGEFKAGANHKEGDFFRFGVYPSNKYAQILPVNINIVPGTDTELAADCNAGDTVIRLKDASKWKGDSLSVVAFDTDPSGKLLDLPNYNISKTGVKSLVSKDGVWELTLLQPCGQNFPAGMTVREHRAGWSVIYAGTAKQLLTPEWQTINVIIEPGEVSSDSIKNWWKGTVKAGFVVEASGSGLVFRNLKLEEVE